MSGGLNFMVYELGWGQRTRTAVMRKNMKSEDLDGIQGAIYMV
jgi:hypothetical protein